MKRSIHLFINERKQIRFIKMTNGKISKQSKPLPLPFINYIPGKCKEGNLIYNLPCMNSGRRR